ncbi:hypothetical protein PanWU01x14_233100 [Parasponia andersonii]|uniref:Uncharacterized protein n=1 Tax=Parasponia andersonii TaxID=3476 RepID=A0A2P5BJS8_PARAD|nr:hypothetical protein PanWU01x14_233100 [Parasponia andersonii]
MFESVRGLAMKWISPVLIWRDSCPHQLLWWCQLQLLREPLAEQALRETIEACDGVLSLDSAKTKLADLVETTRRIGLVTFSFL